METDSFNPYDVPDSVLKSANEVLVWMRQNRMIEFHGLVDGNEIKNTENNKKDMSELEEIVLKTIRESIQEAIKARMSQGYNENPLNKLVDSVVTSHVEELRDILDSAVSKAVRGDFKKELQDAFNHKLARVLVSKFEGEIEKRAAEMRGSPEFRARVTLAIEKAIKE